jgi:hypothetical protein
MGTTGNPVGYWEVDSADKIREWLRKQYTWDKCEVVDLAQGTKRRNNWWLVLREPESGKTRAMVVMTSNRAKSQGFFYTKEIVEDMGPYSTDIPKRLFAMLSPLDEADNYAKEWRERVIIGPARG